jgi:hypothetical protein
MSFTEKGEERWKHTRKSRYRKNLLKVTTKPRDHAIDREETFPSSPHYILSLEKFSACCNKLYRAIFGNRYLITPAHMEYYIEEDKDEVYSASTI